MAEELYFIKTNPNIAKINLYNKLSREEENILSFLQPDAGAQLEIIKDKVKDSVEELTQEELLMIFSWFSNAYRSDREEAKTQLFINGIDVFMKFLLWIMQKIFSRFFLITKSSPASIWTILLMPSISISL